MIVVTGTLRLAPEKMERARPVIAALLAATRQEEGCILYAFGEDVLEPGVLRIVEQWRDWTALEAHGKSAHVGDWRVALKEIGVISRDIAAFEAGESRKL